MLGLLRRHAGRGDGAVGRGWLRSGGARTRGEGRVPGRCWSQQLSSASRRPQAPTCIFFIYAKTKDTICTVYKARRAQREKKIKVEITPEIKILVWFLLKRGYFNKRQLTKPELEWRCQLLILQQGNNRTLFFRMPCVKLSKLHLVYNFWVDMTVQK
jgi:hypothetical protein